MSGIKNDLIKFRLLETLASLRLGYGGDGWLLVG
jgi:hypothetical protein